MSESPSGSTGANRRSVQVLLGSILVVALCSITYELIVGTLSSYLLGNSVFQFSVIIGLYMSAMGVGSYFSKFIENDLLDRFMWVEIGVAVLGGVSASVLFGVFVFFPWIQYAIWAWTFAIGVLVGLEIPLLTRHLRQYEELRVALANVLSWDYIGALGGSLIFPLVLLPQLGLLNSSALIGLMNVGVAVVGVVFLRKELKHPKRLLAAASVVGVGLVSLLATSNLYEDYLDKRLFVDPVVFKEHTPYQNLVMTSWNDDLRLFINGNIQFSSTDEHRYHEALVHPALYASQNPHRIAILGGGDGLALREVLKFQHIKEVVLVDLDPRMTELGRTHPTLRKLNDGALDDVRVKIVNEDAMNYLSQNREPFDVILVDLPDPNNEGLAKLYSVEFYRLVRQRLTLGGVLVAQSTSPYFSPHAFWSINKSMQEGFCEAGCAEGAVVPYHLWVPSFGDWGFNLAMTVPTKSTTWAFDQPARFLTRAAFEGALNFPPDVQVNDVESSRLMAPTILSYYLRDWKRFNP